MPRSSSRSPERRRSEDDRRGEKRPRDRDRGGRGDERDEDRRKHRSRSRERSRRHRSRSPRESRDRKSDRDRDRSRSRRRSRSSSRSRDRKRGHDRKRRRRSSTSSDSSSSSSSSGSSTSSSPPPNRRSQDAPPVRPPSSSAAPAGPSKASSLFGYTADSNPFGDPNLHSTFVWGKKIEKDIHQGKRDRAPTKAEQIMERESLMSEIERARARREAREKEREEMERLKAEEARMKDAAEHADWEKQDDDFTLAQARERSFTRIREGRATLPDLLLGNMWLCLAAAEEVAGVVLTHGLASGSLAEDGANAGLRSAVFLDSPLDLLSGGLALQDEAVRSSLQSEAGQLLSLLRCTSRLRMEDRCLQGALFYLDSLHACVSTPWVQSKTSPSSSSSSSAPQAASDDDPLAGTFEGVSESALLVMESQVEATIARGAAGAQALALNRPYQQLIDGPLPFAASGPGSAAAGAGKAANAAAVDVDYWTRVLARLRRAKAVLVMQRAYENLLFLRLEQLGAFRDIQAPAGAASSGSAESSTATAALGPIPDSLTNELDEDRRHEYLDAGITNLRAAGVLPPLHKKQVVSALSSASSSAAGAADMDAPLDAAGRVLPSGLDEADFGVAAEVVVAPQPSSRHHPASSSSSSSSSVASADTLPLEDKYKPRKPRYFNRVKTGYDWNKYNQTHFDHDNPPPKTVQGYKFNIFYPDLLDKSKTPQFFLEPADDLEHCIIRFHGGPPYEDLAFKIVNKEWEYQKKHGFRCVFDKGVLQLHFNFRRARYRK